MAKLRFSAVMKIRDGNPYLLVSAARAATLRPGWRKPLPVLVRIDGRPRKAWRINMMPAGGGSFYLYLHGDVRKASNTKVGERVTAQVSFDAKYEGGPLHPLPAAFRRALRAEPKAARAWKALSPSRRKEILRYMAALKSESARTRNIEKAIHALGARSAYFMARSWKDGK